MSAAHSTSRDAVDPFATLDAGCAAPALAWIHAGARHAEAGYLDPALGWVGVRADSAANTVHASLVPSSGEAAQVLGSHLAGLNSYVSEHHSGMVTIDAPQGGWGGTDTHPGDHQSSRHEDRASREGPAVPATQVPARFFVGVSPPLPALVLPGAGRYISVLA